MPYSRGAYDLLPNLPSPARSKLSSSRKIDFATGTYVVDENGGFESMSSTAQRVVLLVSYAGGKPSAYITPQDLARTTDRIRKALRVMTDGPSPAIEVTSIDVSRTAPGRTRTFVEFRDLTTGLSQTVQL